LWLAEALGGAGPVHNVPIAVRLDGPLDVERLDDAVRRTLLRHDVLRTVFRSGPDGPEQHVDPALPPALEVVAHPDGDEPGLAALLQRWADTPFDLAAGPPVRIRVVQLRADRHVLSVLLHQLVCDGPSLHRFFDDLATAYAGRELAPLPVQFADYAARLANLQPDPADLAWWREHLAGAPTVLDLPTDRPRPRRRTSAGASTVRLISAEVMEAAFALARARRTTLFAVVLAAYGALLGRLTGRRDVLVGTPVGGRMLAELEPMIGFCVTTAAVRVNVDAEPDAGLGELAAAVGDTVLEVLSRAELPFADVLGELGVERSADHTPLIQTMLTVEPTPMVAPRLAGLHAELIPHVPTASAFDLDLMIVRAGPDTGQFRMTLNYSTELFDARTADGLADRFLRLLAAGVADPVRPTSALPLLDPAERRVLQEWSGAGVAGRQARGTVVDMIRRAAAENPSAPAVRAAGRDLTYAELQAWSAAVAKVVRASGAGVDDPVAVVVPHDAELVPALLGVLRSGATYLPLDARHPARRLRELIRAADCRTVLTTASTAALVDGSGATPLVLAPAPAADRPTPDSPTPDGPLPSLTHLAYVLFTSGSTGRPKPVEVEHLALAAHTEAVVDRYRLGRGDRVLQFAAPTFDVVLEEVLPTLAAGGTVVLRPEPAPSPHELDSLLHRERVSVVNLPAGYWRRWVDGHPELPPSLRLVVVGSEPVDPAAVRAWQRLTAVPLLNAYGLTETTVTATVHELEAGFDAPVVPVGRPLPGVLAHVLDPDGRPVPPGVLGQLHIGGRGLARGYRGDAEATEAAFPVRELDGRPLRLHRTGDLARWRIDGVLELHGRCDQQLSLHGVRIEPAEVEAALREHPGVAEAAASVRVDARGAERLVGYLVPAGGDGRVPADLAGCLAQLLPTALVPTVFVALDALPRTTGGKLDRAALPAPVDPAARPHAAPDGATEHTLAAIWAAVLRLDAVPADVNFFDAGGDSLGLVAVQREIHRLLGRTVPVVALVEFPTIAALARHLDLPTDPAPDPPDGPPNGTARPSGSPPTPHGARARLGARRRMRG
jgi:amino acid adenylation domain-containing protein